MKTFAPLNQRIGEIEHLLGGDARGLAILEDAWQRAEPNQMSLLRSYAQTSAELISGRRIEGNNLPAMLQNIEVALAACPNGARILRAVPTSANNMERLTDLAVAMAKAIVGK